MTVLEQPASEAGRKLLVVAGEVSGEMHGAGLVTELRRLMPEVACVGLGGERLRAVGVETIEDFSGLATVGFTEVVRVLPQAYRIYRRLLGEAERRGIREALLIDSPGLNLRLARALKKRGVRVLYYVSPQLWAWRRGRLETVVKVVDKMMVLFPFEVDLYRGLVEVEHVGHPLVDEIPPYPQAWSSVPDSETPESFHIALLPGSRRGEVERLYPLLLNAGKMLAQRFPVQLRVIRAPTIDEETLREGADAADVEVEIVSAGRRRAIADSHLALCASGTATLEVGLLGTPMVVVYRMGLATYMLARLMVRIPHISLVNLVLQRGAVPELIQGQATQEGVAAAAAEILTDRSRCQTMLADLEEVRRRLGAGGASRRAAAATAEFLRAGASG